MNLNDQRFCIWSGLIFGNLFFVGIYLFGFFPPPDGTLTGEQFIEKIENSIGLARLGIVMGLWAVLFSITWNSIIALHVARAEGARVPLWAIVSFGGGTVNTVGFLFSFLPFAAALYRPDRDPELIRLMVDFGWLIAVVTFSGAVMQAIAMGIGGLRDKREIPVFPRWVCYFLFWIAIASTPGILALFFKTGPFAWNGLLAFWVAAVAFGAYLIVITHALLKAAKNHMLELEQQGAI